MQRGTESQARITGIHRNEHLAKQICALRETVHGRVIKEITSETQRNVAHPFADSFEQANEQVTRASLQSGRQRGGRRASGPSFETTRQPSPDRGLPSCLCPQGVAVPGEQDIQSVVATVRRETRQAFEALPTGFRPESEHLGKVGVELRESGPVPRPVDAANVAFTPAPNAHLRRLVIADHDRCGGKRRQQVGRTGVGEVVVEAREPVVLERRPPLRDRVSGHAVAGSAQSLQQGVERFVGEAGSVESCTPDPCDSLLLARTQDALFIHECDATMANGSTESRRQRHRLLLEEWDGDRAGVSRSPALALSNAC